MFDFLANLFSTRGFPARWHCGPAWAEEPWVGWLHILSDIATFAAYYAVPCVVVYFVLARHNLKFPRIFYVFLGLVFFSCGTVHLIEAGIFWWPVYRLSGVAKLITAVVSCSGVLVLVRVLPKALELKSGEAYREAVSGRREAEASLEFERNLLHTLMNLLPDAIYFKDKSGHYLRISKALADRFQLADPELACGKEERDFVGSDRADKAWREEQQILETGEALTGIVDKETWPDGSVRWASTTRAPLFDKGGNLTGTFGISHDITKIMEAEESLRASEERFELCVRGSNDGIWDWNVRTNDVYYAPRFKELLGYRDDEMDNVFEAWRSRLHPDDVDPTFAAIDAHLEQRAPYDVVYRMRTKRDEYRWFRARGQAVWDESGNATRMAGSITDITGRKQAEERLRRLAAKLALPRESEAVEQPPIRFPSFSLRDMISCGADIRGMSVRAQDRGEFARELVQYLYRRLVDDDGQPALALVRLFRTQTLAEMEDDLQQIAFSVAGDTELAPETKCLTLLGTAGEIADWNDPGRSQGHRAIPLTSVEAVSRLPMIIQLFEQLGLNVAGIVKGDEQLLLRDIGTSVFHVLEAAGSSCIPAQEGFVKPYGIRSVIGFGDLLPSGQFFAIICFSKVALPRETAVLFSHLSLSTKLALLAFEETDSRMEAQIVAVDRLLGNYEDVVCTQEQKLENMLRQLVDARDSAEAANRAKSDFLANMSHEIRTPMNGIIGMSELLANTQLSSEQQDYLGMVKHSADSLLHLLNDILDFSKIEAGKLELEAIPFNLRDTVGKTARTLGMRAAQKGLELNCRIDPRMPENLVGDPNRLRQIIVNLAGNAVKFTEAGEVTIEVEEGARTSQELQLHVSVTDTGIGIPEDKQKRIFDAFNQADETMTRKYGGTGLGLTICSQLVQMMGGRMWVESEVSQGTTFHFTAMFQLTGQAGTATVQQLAELAGTPVLIVDDNATNRRVLEEILASWHLKGVAVEDGASALRELRRAAQRDPYRFVLLDCMMPGMDGFSVAERIKQDSTLRKSTVIMVSSAARPGDAERCRELGIARYMTKPVVQSELLDAILSLAGHRPGAPASWPIGGTDIDLPPMKILLVEDGVINQQVAVGFLKVHGHEVTIAGDGREAVEACMRETFDAVLMDVQMPEMDGFEATSIIRQSEERIGKHTPIIAMTAAAMKGDRERCLQVGMDAYIAKPITARELFETLGRFAPHADAADREAAPIEPPAAEPSGSQPPGAPSSPVSGRVFDPDAALQRVPGDMETVREMARLLLVECPRLMAQIRDGLEGRDPSTVRIGAHTLKSSADIFAAQRVVDLAFELEKIGGHGELDGVESLLAELSSEVDRLIQAINEWLEANQ